MGDVFRFPQPVSRGGQMAAKALDRAAFRAELEAAARDALDIADHIIAALDRFDCADRSACTERGDPVVWFQGAPREVTIASPEQA